MGDEKEGKFYCPGCGQRYKVPGICEGTQEGPHEPINVEPVSSGPHELGQTAPEDRTDEEPITAAKQSAPRKKSATSSRKKRSR